MVFFSLRSLKNYWFDFWYF